MTELNENVNKMPLIGDMAPAFTAVTTQGEINFPTDYQGKWKILFSHFDHHRIDRNLAHFHL